MKKFASYRFALILVNNYLIPLPVNADKIPLSESAAFNFRSGLLTGK